MKDVEYGKRNRILLYIYEFISTMILFYIVDTLFYLERGISSSAYMFFVVVMYITRLIFEIPSGILADKYGKKKILLISQIMFIISTIIFIFAYNYTVFIIAIIIASLQKCFSTGIVNSFLYESLKEKEKFNKVLFIKNTMYCISYMIAMLLGGYLGEKYGLIIDYYVTLIPLILGLIIICFIKDTINNKESNTKRKIDILRNGITEIKNNKFIKNIIFINATMLVIIKLVEESHPEYSIRIGLTESQIGIYTALILVFCIIGEYFGTKLNGEKKYVFIILNPIFVGISILLLGYLNSKTGIIFLLTLYIFSESFNNIIFTEIHNNISSKSRVTIESIISLLESIIGIILGIINSICLSFVSVYQSYIILGIILICYSIKNSIKIKYKVM